jgi:hypothetical protein
MYTNPQIGGKRQRDLLDRAEQQRSAQRFRGRSTTTRQAEPPERHPGWIARMMARLRTVFPHSPRQIADTEAAGDSRTG